MEKKACRDKKKKAYQYLIVVDSSACVCPPTNRYHYLEKGKCLIIRYLNIIKEAETGCMCHLWDSLIDLQQIPAPKQEQLDQWQSSRLCALIFSSEIKSRRTMTSGSAIHQEIKSSLLPEKMPERCLPPERNISYCEPASQPQPASRTQWGPLANCGAACSSVPAPENDELPYGSRRLGTRCMCDPIQNEDGHLDFTCAMT